MGKVSVSRTGRIALAVLVLAAFALMVTLNALANALPLNGVTTGTLSDEIPNLFVPAGLTFSIWGIIYLLLTLLVAVTVIQAFSQKRIEGAWEPFDALLFAANGVANASWIVAWHWRIIPLSLALMLVILGTLIALSERIFAKTSKGGALHKDSSPQASPFVRFVLTTPIHVYLGWICVATIANITALLVASGWGGWGLDPRVWTIVVIAAGLGIALALIFGRRAVAAPIVVVWAYVGIVIKRFGADGSGDPAVWLAASIAALIIVLALAFKLFRAGSKKTETA